ncbi:hypothetical protein [Cryobacterium psychrophilum]|uniref:Uncharacterized protein n=1 Tax=Cryobacterium psychrophilum TaxID=41988 RepID=A0A4Y8KQF3_9MICO|nr:hypothetical protein [Cryobacterium psychrophilum]TDW28630.1 virus M matrix/glycoprotein [Cryobacterium psychrophilum]TFD80375.1 hypothetical protein E3T53_04665 [Cryobacterium psychrophilum]
MVLASIGALLFTWFWILWLGLLVAATILTFVRRKDSELARGIPRVLLVVVWPVLVLGTVVAAVVEPQWDPRSSATVQAAALATLCLIYGLGIAALGVRQRKSARTVDSNRHPLITA